MEHIASKIIKNLPGWIKRQRRERGLTQTILSEMSGVSQGQISKIEAGVITPDAKNFILLFSFFDGNLIEAMAKAKIFDRRERAGKGDSHNRREGRNRRATDVQPHPE